MTFIPNLPDTPYIDQAEPDAGDFSALAERNTGIISGCAVTAQGSPALAVDVAAGAVVVNGVPVAVASGTLAIVAGEAQPRFDLIVVNASGVKSVIKGTADTNPRFPVLNSQTYCWLAAVYVRQSVSSIVANDIVAKQVTVGATFRRTFGDDTTEVVGTTNSVTTKTFKIMSSGEHRWMSSILKRTADSAMEWATSLVLKAADNALALLIMKARTGTSVEIAAQHLLEAQTNGGSVLAYLNGAGQLFADNFKFGTGAPNATVVGNKGDIYIDRAVPTANTALWLKTTDASNTGWVSISMYDPSASALATGSVYAWIGNPATPPANSVYLNGQLLSNSNPVYDDIFAIIGNSYGGTPGVNFAVPDWRDVAPMGAGTIVTLGAKAGATTTTISEEQMPPHDHPVNDPGHDHPIPGFEYLWSPPANPTWIRPWPANLPYLGQTVPSIPYMNIAPEFFNRENDTGITVTSVGGGTPIPTLGPVVGCHWLVRL